MRTPRGGPRLRRNAHGVDVCVCVRERKREKCMGDEWIFLFSSTRLKCKKHERERRERERKTREGKKIVSSLCAWSPANQRFFFFFVISPPAQMTPLEWMNAFFFPHEIYILTHRGKIAKKRRCWLWKKKCNDPFHRFLRNLCRQINGWIYKAGKMFFLDCQKREISVDKSRRGILLFSHLKVVSFSSFADHACTQQTKTQMKWGPPSSFGSWRPNVQAIGQHTVKGWTKMASLVENKKCYLLVYELQL